LDNPKTGKVPNPTKIKGETDIQIYKNRKRNVIRRQVSYRYKLQ
jgi:hypothetical protein